jgi:adenosylcobinamide kinase/adenosylcobinamide-phosphate guanylyltransferase
MRVVLLGTGSADGWPNAWCTCASCAALRARREVRRTTSALVDGVLLLDCGPDSLHQASAAGLALDGVRAVVVTHAHPDHLAPVALLARSWARATAPLLVAGPRSVVDACRHWVGPDDPVSLLVLEAGDLVEVEGCAVRALEAAHDDGVDPLAADALLYDVTAPDGSRLLYATDTAALPASTLDAVSGAAYDVVLLEETFGHEQDHGTGHLDLATFPLQLRVLRAAGAITDRTTVAAVHLSHHNPPDVDRIVSAWGARALPDLAVLDTDGPSPAQPPRRRLVLGGARSGKSVEAERSLAAAPHVTYVATGGTRAGDPEWAARVRLHRERRPRHWTTVETLDVAGALAAASRDDTVLVDCLALWLAGRLDATRTWETDPGTPAYAESLAALERDVAALVAAVRATTARVVLVSNEVGSGVVPEHPSGRLYRDLLGTLNARVAAECDAVSLVVAGRVLAL